MLTPSLLLIVAALSAPGPSEALAFAPRDLELHDIDPLRPWRFAPSTHLVSIDARAAYPASPRLGARVPLAGRGPLHPDPRV